MGGEGPLWSINKNPTRGTLLEETTEAKSPLKGHEIYWQIVSITQGGHNVGQNLINEIDIMVQCISGHLAPPRTRTQVHFSPEQNLNTIRHASYQDIDPLSKKECIKHHQLFIIIHNIITFNTHMSVFSFLSLTSGTFCVLLFICNYTIWLQNLITCKKKKKHEWT